MTHDRSTSRRHSRLGVAGALALAGAAASLAIAEPASATASSAGCTTVRVIAARASTEAPGERIPLAAGASLT